MTGRTLLLVGVALLAGCGQQVQPGAKAFNDRQAAIQRDAAARARVRLVKPPARPNGGYAAMPDSIDARGIRGAPTPAPGIGEDGRSTPPPVWYAARPAIRPAPALPDVSVQRKALDKKPIATPTPSGRITRLAPAELARRIARAEGHRRALLARQDAVLAREAAARRAARERAAAARTTAKGSASGREGRSPTSESSPHGKGNASTRR